MKKILIAAALAAVVATPALAASQGQHARAAAQYRNTATVDGSYAYAPASTVVVSGGQVVGADPDAFIRESLQAQTTNPADFAGN